MIDDRKNPLKEILENGPTTEREKILFDLIRELQAKQEKEFYGLVYGIQSKITDAVVGQETFANIVSRISEKDVAETGSRG